MDTLTLLARTSEPFVVFEAVGALDLHTQGEFEDAVVRELATSSVVVDLSGLEFLAISALRSLMVCHGMADAEGRDLVYAGPSRQTLRLLTVAGLDEVLPLRPSVKDVIAAPVRVAAPSATVSGLPSQPAGSSSPCSSMTSSDSVR